MAAKSVGGKYHAESRGFDFHGLWRLTAWGGVAAFSLALVVVSANSGPGAQQRLATLLSLGSDQADNGDTPNGEPAISEPARPTPLTDAQLRARSTDPEGETRRLAETVRVLAADRDRMLARINTLERSLDEATTGSINRDGPVESRKSDASKFESEPTSSDDAPPVRAPRNAAATVPITASTGATPADTGAAPRPAMPSASAASPAAAPLASPATSVTNPAAGPTPFAAPAPAAVAPKPPPAVVSPSALPSGASSAYPAGWLAVATAMPNRQLTEATAPQTFIEPTTPPAESTAGQAFAGANPVAAADPAAVEPAPARTELGVDVGGGATVEALRTLWTTVRTSAAPLLVNLRPLVVVREVRPGAVELRLVIGPLPNPAAATRLCAALVATRRACRPTAFDGQRLAQLPIQ